MQYVRDRPTLDMYESIASFDGKGWVKIGTGCLLTASARA
jgi:hypothetical protein